MPYTQEYIRHLEKQRRLFIIINLVAVLAWAVMFYLWWTQHNDIQHQRYASVLRNCLDQNTRRANTVKTLNHIILRLPPKQQARAAKNEQFTILLINSLAPHQNCINVAHNALHPPKNSPQPPKP